MNSHPMFNSLTHCNNLWSRVQVKSRIANLKAWRSVISDLDFQTDKEINKMVSVCLLYSGKCVCRALAA